VRRKRKFSLSFLGSELGVQPWTIPFQFCTSSFWVPGATLMDEKSHILSPFPDILSGISSSSWPLTLRRGMRKSSLSFPPSLLHSLVPGLPSAWSSTATLQTRPQFGTELSKWAWPPLCAHSGNLWAQHSEVKCQIGAWDTIGFLA